MEVGAAIVRGVPLPTDVPPHEPLNQASEAPDPPIAVRVIWLTLPVQ